MDIKRLVIFVVLSVAILFGWQTWLAPKPVVTPVGTAAPATTAPAATAAAPTSAATDSASKLLRGNRIKITTDLVQAEIDTMGGDLRQLSFLKHGQIEDPSKPFVLFEEGGKHTYVAQTGLMAATLPNLPTHRTVFTSAISAATLKDGENSVSVRLEAPEVGGVKVAKVYTFHRGSYRIDVNYEVVNGSAAPLNLSAYYRLLRDGRELEGTGGFFGVHTFTGPAVYTEQTKFQKVAFKDIDKGKAEYAKEGNNGWVAMLQHYFASVWLLSPNQGTNVCAQKACRYEVKSVGDGYYSAGAIVDLAPIAAGASGSISVPLYAGPQETKALEAAAPGLQLVKDYGIFKVIAEPMFWVLDKIHGLIGNWGWAIIVFTLLIKIAFYPLSAASARSMAKMKKLAPRMQRLKEQYGDDRMKFQQAVMEMYKQEKANPLSGCLPILIQIPVFMGLYWMLLAAVELRQAPWAFWIHDLSVADPYFVLPVLMAASMYVQALLNPPSPDPMQDKMMKIMPLIFSVFTLFFPAGLVLYWVVNNTFSIIQQWYVNRMIEREDAHAAKSH